MSGTDSIIDDFFSRHASVQTSGFTSSSYKPGLDRMREFDRIVGSPSSHLRCIHVAGTNGKGSVCSMLASALAAAGFRTGLYTSPHLLDFRERMKIVSPDGWQMAPSDYVVDFIREYGAAADEMGLSYFEITTGMAFKWFELQNVDFAVVETGLGGRLDSTNIIRPELSIVTSIGLDHCSILGNTLEDIAREKAGIFKEGIPALVGAPDPRTLPVFEARADELGIPLYFPSEKEVSGPFDLGGEYQNANIRTVLTAMKLLNIPADPDSIRNAASRTGLRGRWEIISRNPLEICDIGHNPPALEKNFSQLRHMMDSGFYDTLHIVYGVMADKALDDIIPLMPCDARYYFTTPSTPRALPAADIAARFHLQFPAAECESTSSVADALSLARAAASPRDIIYVGGSTFVVAEAIR